MSKYKNLRFFKGKSPFLIDLKSDTYVYHPSRGYFLVFVVSTGTGEMKIIPLTVLKSLFGGGPEMEKLIIHLFVCRNYRCLLVGISLAVAGGILQGMIRNPLASPDVLGITGEQL